MPIYEYECKSCGTSVERLEFHNGQSPICCDEDMTRVVSLPSNTVFKGSGFYATEYGTQPQHLSTTDQAIRAQRDCKESGLVAAHPGKTTKEQDQHFRDLERYGG